MILYPILLNLRGARCLIVGGGEVARRKVDHLLEAGARVSVVAPRAHGELRKWAREGRIEFARGGYKSQVLDPAPRLVFACTDDPGVNRAVVADARARKIPVNCADDPENGDFHVPSMVRRGSFLLTVSTGGLAPALAREVCHRFEQQFGPAWGDLTEMLGELRLEWQARGEEAETGPRTRAVLASDAFEVLRSRGKGAARRRVREILKPRPRAASSRRRKS